eukprot:TRINITY_DN29704_c0_g1_i1.p2 TRINITY_DN29704_c0_g1~~TRINITY_DN29704_c0_g1_i1.p2  ORF type:complete len:120 (+),score=17.91 TRINITY_DN29704_c0_g1_i1:461-820(+)
MDVDGAEHSRVSRTPPTSPCEAASPHTASPGNNDFDDMVAMFGNLLSSGLIASSDLLKQGFVDEASVIMTRDTTGCTGEGVKRRGSDLDASTSPSGEAADPVLDTQPPESLKRRAMPPE